MRGNARKIARALKLSKQVTTWATERRGGEEQTIWTWSGLTPISSRAMSYCSARSATSSRTRCWIFPCKTSRRYAPIFGRPHQTVQGIVDRARGRSENHADTVTDQADLGGGHRARRPDRSFSPPQAAGSLSVFRANPWHRVLLRAARAVIARVHGSGVSCCYLKRTGR